MEYLLCTQDLGEILVEPFIAQIAIGCNNINGCIIRTKCCAGKQAAALGIHIKVGVAKMSAESTISSFEKKADCFSCIAIEINRISRPVLAPYRCWPSGIGR